MDSYVCSRCGGVVSCARREAHDTYWCPAAAAQEEEEEAEVGSPEGAMKSWPPPRSEGGRGLGGARAVMSSLCADVVTVRLGSMPNVMFSMEQADIWGPADTGGALWYADRVVAEYLAMGGLAAAAAGAEVTAHAAAAGAIGRAAADSEGLALVLGCGGVPLSGLVASALGWDVVLTDLGVVLEQTRQNVQRNLLAISEARLATSTTSQSRPPVVCVQELRFGEQGELGAALAAAAFVAADGGDGRSPEVAACLKEEGKGREKDGRPLVVLCSDCIWKQELHVPMVQTFISALCHRGGAAALVGFQRRNPRIEAHFMRTLRDQAHILAVEQMDVSEVFPFVQWPQQIRTDGGLDLTVEFVVLRVTPRRGEAHPATSP